MKQIQSFFALSNGLELAGPAPAAATMDCAGVENDDVSEDLRCSRPRSI